VVLLMRRAVVEDHRRIAHMQVVEREPQRFGRRRLGAAGCEAGDQVVDVVMPLGRASQAEFGRVDFERLDHRRRAQQRTDVGVDVEARDFQQRCGGGTGGRGRRRSRCCARSIRATRG
jgi:phage FluMu gp28-like protein